MFRKRKKVTHPPHGAERSHRFSLNWVLGFWKPAMENIMPSDVDHVANFESSTMQDSSSDEYVSCRSLISLPLNSLAVMPNEILEIIFGHLLQQAIYSLTLTNSRFAEIATFHLYDEPIFASTYRFAQFVHVVSYNPQYALLVRSLDLSNIPLQPCDTTKDSPRNYSPCASWRKFKYRNEDMYYVTEDNGALTRSPKSSSPSGSWRKGIWRKQRSLASWKTLKELGMTECHTSSHPPPSPLLKRFECQRDIPIGALCHVLAACRELKKVNLSRIQLADDNIALPESKVFSRKDLFEPREFVTRFLAFPDPSHPWSRPPHWPCTEGHSFPSISSPESLPMFLKFTPDKCDGPINTFSSDVAWPRKRFSCSMRIFPNEIFYWLCTLKELEDVDLSHCMWVTTRRIRRLVSDAARLGDELGDGKRAKGLTMLDLRGCRVWDSTRVARVTYPSWGTKGSREEIERCVREWVEGGGGEDRSLRHSCGTCSVFAHSSTFCGCYLSDNELDGPPGTGKPASAFELSDCFSFTPRGSA